MNAWMRDRPQVRLWVLAGMALASARCLAAWEVVSESSPPTVFGGDDRSISVTFKNGGDKPLPMEAGWRFFQTTSATAVLLRQAPWKTLQAQPGQAIIESLVLDFPAVRAETPFLIQWLESTNHVIGTTEVWAYPTNLLAELQTLAPREDLLGIFDPNSKIKPLLAALNIPFSDLEWAGIARFRGRLAVIGPFDSKAQMPGDLEHRILTAAGKGVGVVWLLPPRHWREKLQPSFQVVPTNARPVIKVQDYLVAGLATNPTAQLNLLHFARLALQTASLPY